MEETKYKIGETVRVIKYGHPVWEKDKDGKLIIIDLNPELIGKEGVISIARKVQGSDTYSLSFPDQRISGFNNYQLESVKKSTGRPISKLLRPIGLNYNVWNPDWERLHDEDDVWDYRHIPLSIGMMGQIKYIEYAQNYSPHIYSTITKESILDYLQELHKAFINDVVYGESIILINPDGTIKSINPYAE